MRLFQYWDAAEPSDEVLAWTQTFRALNPDMKHRLFSRDEAAWFIGKHLGHREQRAFEACAVPSMQSDFFRLCALLHHGGVYADADIVCCKPLSGLVGGVAHGLVGCWEHEIVHDFLFVRAAGDPFLAACLRLCILNIEARDIPNVYTAAGPAVLTAIQALVRPELADELLARFDNLLQEGWLFPAILERARREIPLTDALVRSFDAWTLVQKRVIKPWFGRTDASYKQTGRHWTNWQGPIYLPLATD